MASSLSSHTIINAETENKKPLTLVQQRARQFEALATQQVTTKECWWLADFQARRNLKENPCDCEPCENFKANVDDDNDSEKNNEVNEPIDDVQVDNTTKECHELSAIDRNESCEDNINPNDNDEDLVFVNSDESDEHVVEALNSNVNLLTSPKIDPVVKFTYSNEDAANVTEEDYDSFTDEEEEEEEEEVVEKQEEDVDTKENVAETKLANVVQELIENEKTYIDKLTTGIINYVEPLSCRKLPRSLRGQTYNIFGNIVQIRNFHEEKFYPSLLACNGDIVALSDTFSSYIQNGYFYNYVLYAMNKKRSEKLRDIPANKAFFVDRQNNILEKLGVNSFLMEPIQRLPKYRLLIDQLAKVLSPFLETEKSRLAACSRAEKNVQRLLNTVNESISLNDIVDCNEINLFHQGKFLRQNEFDIYDQDLRRRYRSKVFLFEKSIVYAEKSDEKILYYRGTYPKDSAGIHEYEEGKKFDMYIGKTGHRQIELSSMDFGLIQTWVNLIKEMLVKSFEQEKRKIAKKMHDIRCRNSLRPTDVIVRKSGANYGSASTSGSSRTASSTSSGFSSKSASFASSAYASGLSNFSNVSGYSTGSADSDIPRTTWYTNIEEHGLYSTERKTTENLLNFERHYIHLLSEFVKTELADLSDDIKFQIKIYLKVTNDILRLHREQIFPDLKSCEQNIGQICNVFRTALEYNSLQIYETYCAFVPRAYQIVNKFTGNKNFKHLMNLPVKQIQYYGSMLTNMLVELKESDHFINVRNDLKELALTELDYYKLRKRCNENYNLNQLDPGIAEQYGVVLIAEKVSVGGVEHTFIILQRGIVCVRSRLSTKTQEDKFTKRLFLIDRKCISFVSEKYPTAVKFYDICSRDVKYKVTFSSQEKKNKMIMEVNKIKSNY